MTKVIIIAYREENLWSSCEKITLGLITHYEQLHGKSSTEVIHIDSDIYANLSAVKRIIGKSPNIIIFADQRLNPKNIINPLKNYSFFNEDKAVIYHFYGDPFINKDKIAQTVDSLEGISCSFVFASETNLALAKKLFQKDSHQYLSFLPIAPSSAYEFSSNTRDKIRDKLGIDKRDKLILYTGRISPEKNVDILIKCFQKASETDDKLKLCIIGNFDDYNPYVKSPVGSHRLYIEELLNSVDKNKVIILPYQENIYEYYSASDIFVSLSTMMGDDYGMSAAESLTSGLPCILTFWGGYKNFSLISDHIHYIKLELRKDHFFLNQDELTQLILNTSTITTRALNSKNTKNRLEEYIMKQAPNLGLIKLDSAFINKTTIVKNNISTLMEDINKIQKLYGEMWL